MINRGLNKIASKISNFKYLCSLTIFTIALNSCLESNDVSEKDKNRNQDTSVVIGKSAKNKIDNVVSIDEIKVLIETGDYSKAIDNLLKIRDDLLLTSNSVEKKQELWQIYASLGMCYSEMQEFDKSLVIYDKAYKLAQELDNKERQIRNINDIAVIYLDYIEDKKPCLDYFQKGLELIDNLDQKSFELYQHSIYLIYVNLSNYYVDAKDINSAKKYFNKAKELVDKNLSVVNNETLIRQRKISAFALMTIESDFLIAEVKYQEAIDNYLKAFEIVKELDHKAYQEWIYNAVSGLYIRLGNYKIAYDYKNKAIDVREKRIYSDSQKAIKDSEVKYKTKEIELEKAKTEAQLEAQKQRNRLAWGGAAAALLLALGGAGFSYVLKKKNRIIMAEKAEKEQYAEEVTAINEELKKTNDKLEITNDKLEKANSDINASINYASKIQHSILYNDIQEHFPKSFVFYKPKDIVSGDFYFSAESSKGKKILAVADCTGHGVPGALLTILGKTNIQQIFDKVETPNQIIDHLDIQFLDLQKKARLKDDMVHDSMDISCVFYDPKTKILDFSSALRPIFIFRKDGYLEQVCATNRSEVGSKVKSPTFNGYKNKEIQLHSGDEVILFTDGMNDQFDKNENKLKLAGFKEILSFIFTVPMAERASYLQKFYENLMKKPDGDLVEQTDDMCLVGFKVE